MTNQSRRQIAQLAAELAVRQRRYREEFAALEKAKQAILRSVRSRSRTFEVDRSDMEAGATER